MFGLLSKLTCRVVCGVCGAAAAARRGRTKDALPTFRLLVSRHTEGITIEVALMIAGCARRHRLDPFDLWVLYESPACESIDDAVVKALEMRAFFDIGPDPLDRTTMN